MNTKQNDNGAGRCAESSGSVTPRTDAEEKECAATTPYSDCSCCHVDASFARELEGEIAAIRSEIRETWTAATTARGQMEAYGIMQRMVDRLGYSRTENNPSLIPPNDKLTHGPEDKQ